MNHALIFAGGIGSRMTNSRIPKQFIDVNGVPIIIHTIKAFAKNEQIDNICVICVENWITKLKEYLVSSNIQKVNIIVPGAPTGQQSIYNGLKAIYDSDMSSENDIVLINDGVRPFVSQELIDKCISCVRKHGSVVTVCPVPETVGAIDDLKNGRISDIPDRSKLFLLKAPQGFYLNEIIEAHHKAIAENRFDCTNSAELMKRYGHSLYTVVDSPNNIKITTPIDIEIMKSVIREGLFDD